MLAHLQTHHPVRVTVRGAIILCSNPHKRLTPRSGTLGPGEGPGGVGSRTRVEDPVAEGWSELDDDPLLVEASQDSDQKLFCLMGFCSVEIQMNETFLRCSFGRTRCYRLESNEEPWRWSLVSTTIVAVKRKIRPTDYPLTSTLLCHRHRHCQPCCWVHSGV